MDAYPVYIIISILILALVALFMYFASRRIIFGEDRLVGYSLLGVGVLLAVVDIYFKLRYPLS